MYLTRVTFPFFPNSFPGNEKKKKIEIVYNIVSYHNIMLNIKKVKILINKKYNFFRIFGMNN